MSIEYEPSDIHHPAEARLGRLASRQHGVFTRAQAVALGVHASRLQRRVADGSWVRHQRNVYGLSGAPSTWRRQLLIACLAWGPRAVVSHSSAAEFWRLPVSGKRAIELTVPRGSGANGPGIVHRSLNLSHHDVKTVDAIPVTTVARTLIDLGGSVPRDVVEAALDDALYRGLVTKARLRWRLEELAHRRGTAVLRSLLDQRVEMSAVPQSVFETRLLGCIRDGGLPLPEVQYVVKAGGKHVARVDFAYPQRRLAIEADGRRFHSDRRNFERDRARANELAALGWRLVRVTWTALAQRPDEVVTSIEEALAFA